MAIFIELTVDAFNEQFNKIIKGARSSGRRTGAGVPNVRRPLRGLEIKDDTYAILKVVRANGEEIQLFDSSSLTGDGTSTKYANFLLQSVSEVRMEKQQIVETFGSSFVYFFGEQPRFVDVNAVLLNSLDFNWHAEWWENYEKYLRGTRLVEMGARSYLFYDDNIVEGYILQAQSNTTADNPMLITLSFRMFVTNSANVSFIGDPMYPVRDSVTLPAGVDLTNADAVAQLTPKAPDEPLDLQQSMSQLYVALLQMAAVAQSQQVVARAQTIERQIELQRQAMLSQVKDSLGGRAELAEFMRYGLYFSPYPNQNISEFLRNLSMMSYDQPTPPPEVVRKLPLRSQISDNYDEYTNMSAVGYPEDAYFKTNYNLPVNGPPPDPVGALDKEACKRGAKLGPADMYRMGMLPMTPGEAWSSLKSAGKSAWGAVSDPLGTLKSGVKAVGKGAKDTASDIWQSIKNPQKNPYNGVPGAGYGYRFGYNRSFGYTQGVGGSYGGGMGGGTGAGVGGAYGGYGADPFGNPYYNQQGNPLNQQFFQNSFGAATGSPYGTGYSSSGPNQQTSYYFTAGLAPDGSLQTDSGSYQGAYGYGSPAGYGYSSGSNNYAAGVFGGGADTAAISSMGPGIRGDGVFSLNVVPGQLDTSLGGQKANQTNCGAGSPTTSGYGYNKSIGF